MMASLSGIGTEPAADGIAGALIGMGLPEVVAKRYEGSLKEGNTLIIVHADDSERGSLAEDIFENEGAKDITTGSTANAPKAEERDLEVASPDARNGRSDSNRAGAPQTTGMHQENGTSQSTNGAARTARDPVTQQRARRK